MACKEAVCGINKFKIGDKVNIKYFSKLSTISDYDGERYKCNESDIWHRPITISLALNN